MFGKSRERVHKVNVYSSLQPSSCMFIAIPLRSMQEFIILVLCFIKWTPGTMEVHSTQKRELLCTFLYSLNGRIDHNLFRVRPDFKGRISKTKTKREWKGQTLADGQGNDCLNAIKSKFVIFKPFESKNVEAPRKREESCESF